jgi:DNA-binding IclR family transcriptional regulator
LTTKTKSEISSTVLRAIKIINHLKEVPGPQSLSDISQSLGLSQTIVHRLLTTLKSEGLIFQDPRSKLYSLGTVFLDYANKIMAEMPLAPLVEPQLSKLRDLTGETVGFYVPSGNARVCVLEYESQQEIRRSVGIGRRHPLYLGASGRAILAYMSHEMQESILGSLSEEQKASIRNLLEQTIQDGFSTNEEEITPNVGALSVPVFDHQKRIIGALSVSGPLFRWNRNTMTVFVPIVQKASKAITASFE